MLIIHIAYSLYIMPVILTTAEFPEVSHGFACGQRLFERQYTVHIYNVYIGQWSVVSEYV